MDTQVGLLLDSDGEWAVEKILSHSGAKTGSLFEIQWKSGDITWLSYYQITHLPALTDYLDLLGETKISKLPKGTGKPPQDDPQLFTGAINLSNSTPPSCLTPIFHAIKSQLTTTTQSLLAHIHSAFCKPPFFLSPTIDLKFTMAPNTTQLLPGIDHP